MEQSLSDNCSAASISKIRLNAYLILGSLKYMMQNEYHVICLGCRGKNTAILRYGCNGISKDDELIRDGDMW